MESNLTQSQRLVCGIAYSVPFLDGGRGRRDGADGDTVRDSLTLYRITLSKNVNTLMQIKLRPC